ncbi:DUF6427 family protein [Psychroflexus tropicus]|uniref:DUF6427 family protein n=1 Tax=Psychroflexus tropicus TaxID=197345 RepID=UPI00037B5BCE|nr:DUF6427 family protein [Psychroflexus tropicus]
MLTRLFSHSKPIAYAILSILFIMAFFTENFISSKVEVDTTFVLSKIGVLIVFLLILFLLNFMVKRNKIHQQHTYAISSFVLLIIAFPDILRSVEFIVGYLFLLLSFRRILSLKNNTNIKQKIFDASLFLSISIWFVPMHWLFAVVIYFGIILYVSQNYRHFIIPFVGLSVGIVIHLCFFLLLKNEWTSLSFYFPNFNGVQGLFSDFKYNILLSLILFVLVWVLFQLPSIYSRAKLHERESLSLILFFLFISILVVLVNNTLISKDAVYLIFPLSILIGNYFQLNSTKKWIKESIYILFISGIIFSAIYS